jgi:hypothetical protein
VFPRRRHAARDVDDFCEFPLPLPRLLDDLRRQRADFVPSRYVDRVTADGSLAPLNHTNIWLQFPLGCKLTRAVLGAVDSKVILVSARCGLDPGRHEPSAGCRGLRPYAPFQMERRLVDSPATPGRGVPQGGGLLVG